MTLALVWLLLLWGPRGSGQQLPYKVNGRKVWEVQPSGTTTVRTSLGKTPLVVAIHTWQMQPQGARPAGPYAYPACIGAACSITEWIRVRLGGKSLWVGPYQIAGLANIHYLAIGGSPARLELILVGDDAAESYDAHLIFNNEHVIERVLYAGIDLSHPFEVSHFYYSDIN
ncbi:MAG: hypothetical protein ACRD1A_07975 [Terriglobales bacterium]